MKLLPFPNSRQATPVTCGASVTQAVLKYYGIDKREDELAESLHTTNSEGTSAGQIVKYLKEQGLEVKAGVFNLEDLKLCIDRGIPVILLMQAWANKPKSYVDSNKDGHYVVAIGYDEARQVMIFDDPSLFGNFGFIGYAELEERWHDRDEERVLDHFGIAVFGKPVYNPKAVLHIAKRVACRFTLSGS